MVRTRHRRGPVKDKELPNFYPPGTTARYVGKYRAAQGFIKDPDMSSGKVGVGVRFMQAGCWVKVSAVQAHVLAHRSDFEVRLPNGVRIDLR